MSKAANLPPNAVKKEIHSSEGKTLKMQVPEQCAKLQYLNNCSPIHSYIIYNSIHSNQEKASFIFRPRLVCLSSGGVGPVILKAVKVLDCLVALRQESLDDRFLFCWVCTGKLTVKAFLQTSGRQADDANKQNNGIIKTKTAALEWSCAEEAQKPH